MTIYSRKSRPETGAVAVIVAISAVLLFSVAALAVDLGNAFARKSDVQNTADFAAFAAANVMSNTASGTPSASDPAVVEAAKYLYANWVQTDDGVQRPPTEAALAANLVNGTPFDGQVCYGTFNTLDVCVAQAGKFTVLSPRAQVDFGLAKAMGPGFDNVNVKGHATVAMGSPGGNSVVPFYTVSGGCGWGPQTLSDPARGHADALGAPPPLDLATAPNVYTGNPTVSTVLDATTATNQIYSTYTDNLEITGPNGMGTNNYTKVTAVGFFRDKTQTDYTTSNYRIINATAVAGNSKLIRISIPSLFAAPVSLEDGVWYVRLRVGTQWSTPTSSQALKVGDPSLRCPGLSTSGNFGSLKLPRAGDTVTSLNDILAKNMAVGPKFTLAVYPNGGATTGYCTTVTQAPLRKLAPTAGTNCVDTDTGLSANATTKGMITGLSDGTKGRLDASVAGHQTTCGVPSAKTTNGSLLNKSINNDILSCFMTTDVSLSNITKDETVYTGPVGVLSPDIYSSPRFLWVPEFKVSAGTGGSNLYLIVDFRPAFITNETNTSKKSVPVQVGPTTNGLLVANNGITSLSVVFFHKEALPNSAGGAPIGPYLGVGPRVIQLVD